MLDCLCFVTGSLFRKNVWTDAVGLVKKRTSSSGPSLPDRWENCFFIEFGCQWCVAGRDGESCTYDTVDTGFLVLHWNKGIPVDHEVSECRLPVDGRLECMSGGWASDSNVEVRKWVVAFVFICELDGWMKVVQNGQNVINFRIEINEHDRNVDISVPFAHTYSLELTHQCCFCGSHHWSKGSIHGNAIVLYIHLVVEGEVRFRYGRSK